MADEAYPIGPAPARESYLRIDKLMEIARRAGCDALHPGYGFLAENRRTAAGLRRGGHRLCGPFGRGDGAAWLENGCAATGSSSRRAMVPGVREPIPQLRGSKPHRGRDRLSHIAESGGRRRRKGMRVVASANELPPAWRDAASEALNAFGDARVYIEKYLDRPAAHRDTNFRRRTRKCHLSWRTRMFGAAAPSESDRGSALAFYDS